MPAEDDATPERNPAAEQRRAVEALAEALYEANNLDGVAWVKRPRIVRDPWLTRARQQLSRPEEAVAPDPERSTKLRDFR